jgi:hypothetical protein
MSFFSHIQDVVTIVVSGLEKVKGVFTKQNIDKAVAIGKRVSDIAAIALPYVSELAQLVNAASGGTTIDPNLIAAATKMNTTIDAILANADAAAKKGQLLTVAGDAAMLKLSQMLETGHVSIGDMVLTAPADISKIPTNQIDAAVQSMFTFLVKPSLASSGI